MTAGRLLLAPELPSLPQAESWGEAGERVRRGTRASPALLQPGEPGWKRAAPRGHYSLAANVQLADLEREPPMERGKEREEPSGEYSQFASNKLPVSFLLLRCNRAGRDSCVSSSISKVSGALPRSLFPPYFSCCMLKVIWKRKSWVI